MAAFQSASPTPKLDEFLSALGNFIQARSGVQVQQYLIIEPPYNETYLALIAEIQQRFPSGQEAALEKLIIERLPGVNQNWPAYIKFMVHYFYFIVKVDMNDLLATYNLLSDLFIKATTALSSTTYGTTILATVIVYSKTLAKLAIGLDKRPDLIAHLRTNDEDETLPERAGNIIRQALAATLNDRSVADSAAPTGIKAGSLILANLWLKILFQCNKIRHAEYIFNIIPRQAPPLPMYPKPQQVTYLYYLGRYQFSNGHFYRAILALEAALKMCPSHFPRQRRLILVYLVTSSIILGRFPTQALFALPEAIGFAERFTPICQAIQTGDLYTFRKAVDINGEHAPWFLHHRILLQLQSRCEVLVWRSLVRRVFLINGTQGDVATRRAPTLDLFFVALSARYLEKKLLLPMSTLDHGPGRRHTNFIFMATEPSFKSVYVDPEFAGLEVDEMLNCINTGKPPQKDNVFKTMIPDLREVEAIMYALIHQGLLNGYISHAQKRFAIHGARHNKPIVAGFPNVWDTLTSKEASEVPGWKKSAGSDTGPRTIRLSGVRGVGQ